MRRSSLVASPAAAARRAIGVGDRGRAGAGGPARRVAGGCVRPIGLPGVGSIAVPQDMQNRASGSAGVPHAGQLRSSFAPHEAQNRAFAGFSAAQSPHTRVCGMVPTMMTTTRRDGRKSKPRALAASSRWADAEGLSDRRPEAIVLARSCRRRHGCPRVAVRPRRPRAGGRTESPGPGRTPHGAARST